MAENSKIEWTDATFNPWIGCTKVSPGCANCYAAAQDAFRGWTPEGWGPGKPRRRTKTWAQPVKWDNQRMAWLLANTDYGKPRTADPLPHRPRVFCASLADWLDEEVPGQWRHDLLDLIHSTPCLDWQLLTKRPQFWRPLIDEAAGRGSDLAQRWLAGEAPANVWVGTTVEDQQRANERIPELLKIPARVRFLSCEPLLGPVVLPAGHVHVGFPDHITGEGRAVGAKLGIHWVICGGESGPGARPMHPDWARSLEDQCATHGVAFFFKQWGDWLPARQEMARATTATARDKHQFSDGVEAFRVGKVNAGRLLDGEEYSAFPA